ncbi:MAG: tRNA (adenosine(37)-N6)-dimethylallyltransferase MiaA [Nitrospiraceae bacterium]|jgi:tRNA dimethylallyltransferase|nr:MAG: tRNA (adenosine(37)-N6)-dimethylallyltransferase MiaA [Nitrospiraceae bacterium]
MNKVIIILGPTGVGKTGASILLARRLATEIISADSMQIYRGMDIGTAKPPARIREEVRHHMIDIVSPTESYSVGQYLTTVVPIIEQLHQKGLLPIIVGGTGLYITALTRGLFRGPPADQTLRDEMLSMEKNEKGILYSHLRHMDPATAENIKSNDTRRIVRALEVCINTKSKMSSMQRMFTNPLPYTFKRIGLIRDRSELYRMLEERVDSMIASGLIQEVSTILDMIPDRTPLQAIGYKEIAQYLSENISREEAIRLVKRNTKRYAKRQLTWFRKDPAIHWVDISGVHNSETICRMITDTLLEHNITGNLGQLTTLL